MSGHGAVDRTAGSRASGRPRPAGQGFHGLPGFQRLPGIAPEQRDAPARARQLAGQQITIFNKYLTKISKSAATIGKLDGPTGACAAQSRGAGRC